MQLVSYTFYLNFLLILLTTTSQAAHCPTQNQKVTINGNSMSPLFKHDQEVLVQNGYYACHTVRRGDVITLTHTGHKNLLIKRVIAIPGDKYRYEAKHIYINGKIATNSDGLNFEIESKMLALYAKSYPVIPAENYLVLGDQPGGSLDASKFGLIEKNQIIGRVMKEKKIKHKQ